MKTQISASRNSSREKFNTAFEELKAKDLIDQGTENNKKSIEHWTKQKLTQEKVYTDSIINKGYNAEAISNKLFSIETEIEFAMVAVKKELKNEGMETAKKLSLLEAIQEMIKTMKQYKENISTLAKITGDLKKKVGNGILQMEEIKKEKEYYKTKSIKLEKMHNDEESIIKGLRTRIEESSKTSEEITKVAKSELEIAKDYVIKELKQRGIQINSPTESLESLCKILLIDNKNDF